jgi:hypothetical protein
MPDLKPCPNCGSTAVQVESDATHHWVACPDCLMCGPYRSAESSAVRYWSALPRVSSPQDRPAEDDNPPETGRENPGIAKESEMRLDIAIRAMQAMLLSGGYETMFPDGLACDAVRLADAMVEELGESPPSQ